jgi:hypothetical protein
MIIMSKSLDAVLEVKQSLSNRFKMQDFGEASVVLGIRIRRIKEQGVLMMDQEKYIEGILSKFGMDKCNGVSIPLSCGVNLSKSQSPEETEEVPDVPYRQVIGSLMYLMVSTRPDIAASIQILSRFSSNPGLTHWSAAKKVMQYLRRTSKYGITYFKDEGTNLCGFCDADFGSCLDTSRSTTGYVFLLGGGAISWSSKR